MSQHEIPYKIYLQESEMPTRWYNLRADMKNKPAPLLNPATLQPCKPEDVANILLFLASDESRAITGQILVTDFGCFMG